MLNLERGNELWPFQPDGRVVDCGRVRSYQRGAGWSIAQFSAVLLGSFLSAAAAHAGVRVIGPLIPSGTHTGGAAVEAIAFDGSPDPLVLDRLSWALERVSTQDATVLSSAVSPPAPDGFNSQLVYDGATGDFYTVRLNQTLVRISGATLSHSPVGSGIGAFFNFVSIAEDPAGNLWLATDAGSGELWTVDKQTGVGTVQTSIHLPPNHQLTSMTIDTAGDMIVYAYSNDVATPSYICKVDPSTGATSILSQGSDNAFAFLNAMSYDPASASFYGILEDRSNTSDYTFSLVQVTGVSLPEPLSVCALGACCLIALRRRRVERSEKEVAAF